MNRSIKYCLLTIGMAGCLMAALAFLPYTLVASPSATLKVVDENGKPLEGIRVTRQWDTSENQKGADQSITDSSGQVSFTRVEYRMTWLKRVTKPLLIFVPASCGPGWEVYGHSEFNVYWPQYCTLKFNKADWEKVHATYENREGIHIYDPDQSSQTNYVKLYTFNKRDDFAYTLKLYRADHK
jgi:hypothetical protein